MVGARRGSISAGPSPRSIKLSYLGITLLAAVLLTARYKLLAPEGHAYGGAGQSIGHQAYELAFNASTPTTANDKVQAAGGSASDEYDDEWYTATQPRPWDPLSTDTRPITEITVKSCVLPPGLYDVCSPLSSKKEDALRGEWERVDRDLNKRIGITYLYLFVRRLQPGSTAAVVTNLSLLTHSPTIDDLSGAGIWHEVSESVRDGVWPRMSAMFLHYQTATQDQVFAARRASKNASAGALEPITNLDVSYGASEVRPLPGYEKLPVLITGGADDDKRVDVATGKGARVGSTIAFRRALPTLPRVPDLQFSKDGRFRILQVADLHFSVGPGECRDMDPKHEAECRKVGADNYSIAWLIQAIEEVKPDLVVLSGDQLNGQDSSWSAESTVLKWAPVLYDRQLPWTVVFGNHDEEKTDLDKRQQMALMTQLPYFIGEAGPDGVDGVGNYLRAVRAPGGSATTLFNLYFLDSHANVRSLSPWAKPGYDFIKPAQINWFKGKSSRVSTLKRPWSLNEAREVRQRRNRKNAGLVRRRAAVQGRQLEAGDGFSGDSTADLTDEQVAQLQEIIEEEIIEEQFEAQAEEALLEAIESGDSSGFSAAVEEDDGSNIENIAVVDDQPPEPTALDAEAAAAVNLNLQEIASSTAAPTVLPDTPTAREPFLAKPNAMAFFHIPLPEAYAAADAGQDGEPLIVGERYEGSGASRTNGGFFEQAVLRQGERVVDATASAPMDSFWEGEFAAPTEGRPEVKVVANGHCHVSSSCRRVQGVWLCFGGGGSFSGYGKAGFARRMRVYEVAEFGEKVETYQVLDSGERTEVTVLVGEGALGD